MNALSPSTGPRFADGGAASAAPPSRRLLNAIADRVPFTTVLAALWAASFLPAQAMEQDRALGFIMATLTGPIVTMTLLVALSACVDIRTRRRRSRAVMLGIAAAVSALLGESIEMAALHALGVWSLPLPAQVIFWANFGNQLSVCLIAVYTYDYYSRAKRRAAALRELRRSRASTEKQTIEARLRAMQARVDPQWLFDTLAAVESLQKTSPDAGGRLLDDLIAYLRAALPEGRAQSATLGKELDLAVAWVGIQRALCNRDIRFRVDVQDDLRAAPFPPHILTPLVEAVRLSAVGTAQVTVAVSATPETLVVRVENEAQANVAPCDESPQLAALRGRLTELYGDAARLVRAPEGCAYTLERRRADPESADR